LGTEKKPGDLRWPKGVAKGKEANEVGGETERGEGGGGPHLRPL